MDDLLTDLTILRSGKRYRETTPTRRQRIEGRKIWNGLKAIEHLTECHVLHGARTAVVAKLAVCFSR